LSIMLKPAFFHTPSQYEQSVDRAYKTLVKEIDVVPGQSLLVSSFAYPATASPR
jgi:hypothetical protein